MDSLERLKGLLARPMKRYTASIIDGAIVMAFVIPLYLFGAYKDYATDALTSFVVFCFVVKLIVYVIVDVIIPYLYDGKTLGRMVMNITLVQSNGKPIELLNLARRASIFIVVALISDIMFASNIAFLIWALVFMMSIYFIYNDVLRQTVHDKVADTVMLDDTKVEEEKNKSK